MKHIIIGGVAGGATAAARIRRADEFAEIILLEKGKNISYANCGLPYYIGDVIKDREQLFVQTPESFSLRFNVDVRVQHEAVKINSKSKTIEIKTTDGVEYSESYDKLLLSPGAKPLIPPLKGINNDGIFVLRNVVDTDKIKSYIRNHDIKRSVVIGAGFIGLEMAENLHNIGSQVSIVEMMNQVMTPVDYSIASQVHEHLSQKGIHLYLNNTVDSFEKRQDGIRIYFKNGNLIDADIIILSMGVRPETKLAIDTQLKIGETGGIWVDEYLQTSEKDIYAVGDAIEFPHPLTGKPWLNYLANPANRQGRIVADNMVFGNQTKYEGAIGTSIAKVMDIMVGSTGLPSKRLRKLGIEYQSYTTHSGSHAGYYPDALPISIKLTFDPKTGKLFGAQCVGFDGIDKRIDQAALVIKNGGIIYDLIKIEHAYAPPFSSAKDPITIAGYAAQNIINGTMPVVKWHDVRDMDTENTILLDIRTKEEHELATIKGSLHIPLYELRNRLDEIPKDKHIYVYCAIGIRGYLALKILKANGFKNVYNLSGGYKTYASAMAPIRNSKPNIIHDKNTDPQDFIDNNVNHDHRPKEAKEVIEIDACGMMCPGPIIKLKKAMDNIRDGQRVSVTSTDAGFLRDAEAWSNSTGNIFINKKSEKGKFNVVIEKASKDNQSNTVVKTEPGKGKTFIVFSDDLDKVLASFVLANGAAATGEKVTIFFTFWGLNAIKREDKPKVKKDMFAKMFSKMLPSSTKHLNLSKMNMGGMGAKMMRRIMKQKGVDSLEEMRQQALDQGVEFIACQMSMDVMGVSKEELLDEVTIGGVATYMDRAVQSNVNLFI